MRKFGLIGYPLGHSFSRRYFSEKFVRENIPDCSYENYPLSEIGKLTELVKSEKELEGLNVTIPYKSSVTAYLDEIEHEARQIGAVNVIKIIRLNNKVILRGFNSDITGIRDSLIPLLRPDVRNALVLGSGGSSKAVCHVLAGLDIEFKIVSRSWKKGYLTYSDLNNEIMRHHLLIINTTPLGMFPATEGKPDLDYRLIGKDHIMFDLVYNPGITTFLRLGQEIGATTLNGLKMLHRQAERSWEIWNDDNL